MVVGEERDQFGTGGDVVDRDGVVLVFEVRVWVRRRRGDGGEGRGVDLQGRRRADVSGTHHRVFSDGARASHAPGVQSRAGGAQGERRAMRHVHVDVATSRRHRGGDLRFGDGRGERGVEHHGRGRGWFDGRHDSSRRVRRRQIRDDEEVVRTQRRGFEGVLLLHRFHVRREAFRKRGVPGVRQRRRAIEEARRRKGVAHRRLGDVGFRYEKAEIRRVSLL